MSARRSRASARASAPAPRSPAAPRAPGHFWRRAVPLLVLGLVGVASLAIVIVPMLPYLAPPPAFAGLPRWSLVLAAMANPTLLLLAGALVGAALAHRVGLRSHVAARAERGEPIWPRLRGELPVALAVGVALGLAMGGLDLLFRPRLGYVWLAADPQMGPRDLPALVSGMLYGGLTEEVQLRWGLLSLVAWLGWRLVQRGQGALRAGVAWGAIVVVALLFGALNLPATADVAPLTGWLVARTMTVNALAALVLGWLYWRRSLESAMLAHAVALVGLFLLNVMG